MPCFRPLKGWRSKHVNPVTGKRPVTFNRNEAYIDLPVTLPCGKCAGCLLARSRDWAVRIHNEASLYAPYNSFITLTFENKHLPKSGLAEYKYYQHFMKRFRKKFGNGKRFFMCAEYGTETKRPHYHAILFDTWFDDRELFKISPAGERLYISPTLDKLWPFGFHSIGDVTIQSASYVARYVTKKAYTKGLLDSDMQFDHRTGEVFTEKLEEYTKQSLKPAIGRPWYDKFKEDIYPEGNIHINGKTFPIPRYYREAYTIEEPDKALVLKRKTLSHVRNNPEFSSERLEVKEKISKKRIDKLVRGL